MRFSIIIIHRNNYKNLRDLVESIVYSMNDKDEIIVIDNNSSDNSIQKLKKSTLNKKISKIIENKCNAGYGYSCNQGMKMARGTYFLLCNNDIKLKKETLDKFHRLLESSKNIGLIGPQMISPTGKKMRSYSSIRPSIFTQLDLIGRPFIEKSIKKFSKVEILRGACLAVNSLLVKEIGCYDEDFYFYHEETEWCMRINESKKWKVMFAPEIEISHVGGASTSTVYAKSRIEFIRSRLIFWSKVFPKYQVLILYSWNIPKLFIDAFFYFIATIFTFGLNKTFRKKTTDRFIVILWFLSGMPKGWGLPNKCN